MTPTITAVALAPGRVLRPVNGDVLGQERRAVFTLSSCRVGRSAADAEARAPSGTAEYPPSRKTHQKNKIVEILHKAKARRGDALLSARLRGRKEST